MATRIHTPFHNYGEGGEEVRLTLYEMITIQWLWVYEKVFGISCSRVLIRISLEKFQELFISIK